MIAEFNVELVVILRLHDPDDPVSNDRVSLRIRSSLARKFGNPFQTRRRPLVPTIAEFKPIPYIKVIRGRNSWKRNITRLIN